jgi:D-alanyl-D-alanine carboxypeptidase
MRTSRRSAARSAFAGLSIAVITALLGGCAPAAVKPTPENTGEASVTLDEATTGMLQQLFDDGFADSGMPGAAAFVRIGDETWEASTGVGDLETQDPYDPAAHVRIASNTKTFTATAVLQLVDEGVVSLDDTLEQYIPGIVNGERITVRDLLQMSSGVWDFTSDTELMGRWADDLTMPWTVDDTIALIATQQPQFEPGEKVLYTDSNYVLLGRIAELASGLPMHELVQTRILDPLGMTDTRYPAPDEPGIPDPHQQGYRPPAEQLGSLDTLIPVGDINPEVAWGAGNMTSTIADLAIWADALADGELLSPELQAERIDSREFDGQKIEFGYGLGIIRLGDFLGHDGAISGYSTVAMRLPEADATFVLVGNGSSNFTTPSMDIFLSMVQALYPEQIRPLG